MNLVGRAGTARKIRFPKSGGGVRYHICLVAEASCHPCGRLNGVVGNNTANHQSENLLSSKYVRQLGVDECAVSMLGNNKLTVVGFHFVLELNADLARAIRGVWLA